ncbi:hypothetical protein QZJ86_16845 [Methylomonas montana]|uniref:hypothetical protein n=1 Tax=Methylomonas montana TaxID=3058963 RepID=UPI00265AAD0E|nr:hypothetical protein [Methylomonas montana]WKJ89670.1 hypothetical protein QZJ86_16845 [Methylomonas montana]
MLSPEDSNSLDEHWLEEQRNALLAYSDKIEFCISHADWETLTMVLESRHTYLQQLFSPAIPFEWQASLKQLAELVLQQDVLFKSRVEEQKRIVAQQQLAFDRGRQAVQAYRNQ